MGQAFTVVSMYKIETGYTYETIKDIITTMIETKLDILREDVINQASLMIEEGITDFSVEILPRGKGDIVDIDIAESYIHDIDTIKSESISRIVTMLYDEIIEERNEENLNDIDEFSEI